MHHLDDNTLLMSLKGLQLSKRGFSAADTLVMSRHT